MLRYVKNGMLILSIAFIALGLLLLVMPETSLLWICYAFGAVVLITGIVCLVQYARLRGSGFAAPFFLVAGVITAALGLFTLAQPQVVASFLPVVFGLFILIDGCSRIGTAIELARRRADKWWMMLLFSVLSIALGVLLLVNPFGAAVSVVMVCGVLLIIEGVVNLSCVVYTAMELRTLDRMADAAQTAALDALGQMLDEEEAEALNRDHDGVVYNAESTEVSDDTHQSQ
ncbi:HdeD family acid-resistance protein [Subdoligranulum variabile]|uniref:Acid-resistance membrane protein n=1 Tax=Subdoligranulum variabile DSM 15176 TaxID=411471 RepID=D1PIE6_9FIRM|nr:DUF308 domain-containing protein [Subdoligranulum variabile]EFB77531.1 hypothetical protein SUBVAR_04111 [Subdoligranulum variabile DSM 15176]UWP67208.1 DUF308 domain-containing protein [Subdoligranulum variabile]